MDIPAALSLTEVELLTLQLTQSQLELATAKRDLFCQRLANKYGQGGDIHLGMDGTITLTSKPTTTET